MADKLKFALPRGSPKSLEHCSWFGCHDFCISAKFKELHLTFFPLQKGIFFVQSRALILVWDYVQHRLDDWTLPLPRAFKTFVNDENSHEIFFPYRGYRLLCKAACTDGNIRFAETTSVMNGWPFLYPMRSCEKSYYRVEEGYRLTTFHPFSLRRGKRYLFSGVSFGLDPNVHFPDWINLRPGFRLAARVDCRVVEGAPVFQLPVIEKDRGFRMEGLEGV